MASAGRAENCGEKSLPSHRPEAVFPQETCIRPALWGGPPSWVLGTGMVLVPMCGRGGGHEERSVGEYSQAMAPKAMHKVTPVP